MVINDYDYTNELHTIRKITVDSGLLKNDYDIVISSVSVLMLNNQIEVPVLEFWSAILGSDGTLLYCLMKRPILLVLAKSLPKAFDYTITDANDSLTSAQLIINYWHERFSGGS